MNELPLMTRLLIALVPKITLHISDGVTRSVPLSKVINIGRDKMERTIRKQQRKREELPA